MRSRAITLLRWSSWAALFLLALGFGGALHPVGDSFGVFRPYLSLLLIVLGLGLLLFREVKWGGVSVLIGAGLFASLGIIDLTIDDGPARGERVYRHYQKNLLWLNDDKRGLLRDIRRRRPDTVTLQEVHRRNDVIRKGLEKTFPAHHYCDFVGVGGVQVFSRWPVIEGTKDCLWGAAVMQVEAPDGPLWVISLHLHWVYPYDSAKQVADLVPELEKLKGPKVLGGDFNTTPWTKAFRDVARAAEVERFDRVYVTIASHARLLRVPIDHVLTTRGEGVTYRLPLYGSDHHGVWAEYTLPDS